MRTPPARSVLEYLRDLAAARGDQTTRDRAGQLADELDRATATAADFIELNYPPAKC